MFTDLNIKFPYQSIKNCCKSSESKLSYDVVNNDKIDPFIENSEYLSRKADMIFLNQLPKHGCDTCIATEPNSLFRSWNEWEDREFDNDELVGLYRKDSLNLYELVLNSTCDLKCVYCGPNDSSSWALELGEKKREPTENWKKKVEHRLINHLKNKSYEEHPVYFFYFSGGEPTYNTETLDFINRIIQIVPKEKALIVISTNLNTKPAVYKKFMQMIDDNKDVVFVLDCSFEDIGDRCEAIRTGLNWERAMNNMDLALTKDNVYVRIAATPNLYSIPNTKQFLEYFVEKFKAAGKFIEENTELRKGILYTMFNANMVQESPLTPMSMPERYKETLDEAIEYCNEAGLLNYSKHLVHIKKLIGSKINENTADVVERKFNYFKEKRPEYDWDNLFPHVNEIVKELRGNNG